MMVEALDTRIRAIYAPVEEGLAQVDANLMNVAANAGLSVDDQLLARALLSGGKKVRPAITLLSARLFGGIDDRLIAMATAVELLHIASLIHDDTIDSAMTRRGRPTASSLWGEKVAVLFGDYMFAKSATFVCDTGNIAVIRRFSENIMELARGELAEHFSANDWSQTVDDYVGRTYDKTASLFRTAAESGAVLAGASPEGADALKRYGCNIGMAFQIMDDVLDFLGTEEELGKPVGNDLLQGTLTLPVLLFAQRHPEDATLRRLRGGGTRDDLDAMVAAVAASDALEETLRLGDDYRRAAEASLRGVGDAGVRASLEELTRYLATRRN